MVFTAWLIGCSLPGASPILQIGWTTSVYPSAEGHPGRLVWYCVSYGALAFSWWLCWLSNQCSVLTVLKAPHCHCRIPLYANWAITDSLGWAELYVWLMERWPNLRIRHAKFRHMVFSGTWPADRPFLHKKVRSGNRLRQSDCCRWYIFLLDKFLAENIKAIKDSICLYSTDNGTRSGKTGTEEVNGHNTSGWFIGYVKKGSRTYFFATNIQSKELASGPLATELTFSILSDL